MHLTTRLRQCDVLSDKDSGKRVYVYIYIYIYIYQKYDTALQTGTYPHDTRLSNHVKRFYPNYCSQCHLWVNHHPWPLLVLWITLIKAWIVATAVQQVWEEINYPFPNWKWIMYFSHHFIVDVITCACRDQSMLVEGPRRKLSWYPVSRVIWTSLLNKPYVMEESPL